VETPWLKNNNPPGDFLKSARCGAQTRHRTSCRAPAMSNGRCRFHGGLSTGPRTPAGPEHSRKARWKHGARSREIREVLRANRERWRDLMALLGGSQNHARPQHGFESPTGLNMTVRVGGWFRRAVGRAAGRTDEHYRGKTSVVQWLENLVERAAKVTERELSVPAVTSTGTERTLTNGVSHFSSKERGSVELGDLHPSVTGL
jgi:hypothetical protein